jgi:tetratricopeptide (TPR) repeat protein
MRLCTGAAVALVLFIASAAAAQEAPPLPRLALERFPEAARASVSGAYEKARARPDDAEAVGAFARIAHAWEQWEAAHNAYRRAQALAPKVFEWQYLDGVLLQRLVRHTEAAERLRAAVALRPDYAPARVKLAESLFEAGDVREAGRLFEALAKEPLTEPMGRFGLAKIAAAEGKHDAAIEHLRRAIELFPEWGSALYALALSYRALGRREEAQRALAEHARYGPQWPGLEDPVLAALAEVRDDARALLQRGVKLAGLGDLAGAIETHEAALAQEPTLARAHANLISLYGRQKNWAKAAEHYEAVVKLGAELETAHYDYAVLLGMQGRMEEAEAAYRRALEVNPLHAQALNNLGELLERQRKLEEALDLYRRAAAAQPLFRLARFNVGRMLLALGRPADAVAEFEKLTEPRDAEAPRYLFALATAYVRNGQKEAGIKWANEARQLALQYGQAELAAAIDRNLAQLK